MRYFVHVYRTVRSKFLIEAPDRPAAMKLAVEALPAANDRLQWDRFKFSDDEARRVPGLLSGTHIATEDAEEITGYLIDEVGDDEFERSVSYNGSGERMHDGPGKSHTFTPRQRDTILAGLRLWQAVMDARLALYNGQHDTFAEIHDQIAVGDHGIPLTPEEIDALCESINT